MLSAEARDFIREYYARYFGVEQDDFMVLSNDVKDDEQVDIIWVKPTKKFNYNILATCGVSNVQMENPPQCIELMMLLPADWKIDDKKDEWWWPLELLTQIAYLPFKGQELTYGSVVSLTKDDKPFMKGTKNCGAIVTFPEHFPPEMFEHEVEDGLFIRFFQCVPIDKDDMERIEENGPFKFIEFNLHNADGPDFVVKKK